MDKFLYFSAGADSAGMFPLSRLRGFAMTADATILVTFDSFRNGTADLDRDTVTITCTSDKQKEVYQDIVAKINAHPNGDPFVVVADKLNSVYASSHITDVAISYAS
jgi:hypothetical protein